MATHPGIPTWEIPWTEESGRLQSTGLQKVRHNCATEHTHTHTPHGPLDVKAILDYPVGPI